MTQLTPGQWLDAIADEGLSADITQIILPPPALPSPTTPKDQTHNLLDGYFTYHLFWRRVGLVADMVAEYPPTIRFTLVGLDGVGRPSPTVGAGRGGGAAEPPVGGVEGMGGEDARTVEGSATEAEGERGGSGKVQAEEDAEEDAEEADAEDDFRHRVATRMRVLAEAKGVVAEEELREAMRARQEAIVFMSLPEYLLTHDWEGEVPLAVAHEVLSGPLGRS